MADRWFGYKPFNHFSLTDGLEALEWVRDTDEVLSIYQPAAGVIILARFSCWWEVRGAVDQPEALMFVQQNNSWSDVEMNKWSE